MANRETQHEKQFIGPDVADAMVRLAKISGQVQGISRMLSDGRYCVGLLDQIASARDAPGRGIPPGDKQLPGVVRC